MLGGNILTIEPKEARSEAPNPRSQFGPIVSSSPPMQRLLAIAAKMAPTDLSLLIVGETGTGKEMLARAIHGASSRADGPFVVFDCAAANPNLVASELFGHERGSFTGAVESRDGVFAAAQGGTLFLDELGELPLRMQPHLLRAIERREVKPVGGTTYRPVDVRILAATYRRLEDSDFRSDLLYRVAEAIMEVPPLRQRREDIEALALEFLQEDVGQEEMVPSLAISGLHWLMNQRWPGNVREIRNLVRRAHALTSNDSLDAQTFREAAKLNTGPQTLQESEEEDFPRLEDARKRWHTALDHAYLVELIERWDWNVREAAQAAGLNRRSLTRLLQQHGIRRTRWPKRNR